MCSSDLDDIVENAGTGARTSKQLIALLKLRYGLTDNLEALLVPGYIYVYRDAYDRFDSDHLGGPNDAKLGINYGILQQKQGDPLSLCLTKPNRPNTEGATPAQIPAAHRKPTQKQLFLPSP